MERRQTSFILSTEQDEVALRPMSRWERMLADYRLMELSPDTHPLALLRKGFPKGAVTTEQLHHLGDGKRVRIGGLVVTRQRPGTAKGFLFLLLEDEFGLVNVVVSPQLHERRRAVIRGEALIWLQGTVQRRSGTLNLIATDVWPLLEALREREPGDPADPLDALLNELRGTAPAAHQWR